MKRHFIKYSGAFLFVCLFLFKGITTVVPLFMKTDRFEAKHITLPGEESEDNKKNAEEKIEKESKEIYTNDHLALHGIDADVLLNKVTAARNEWYKSCVYLAIATPPPESQETV